MTLNLFTNTEVSDDGWPVLALAGLLTILATIMALPLGCLMLGMMVWLSHILRVPDRHPPLQDSIIVAPVDGRIVQISNIGRSDNGMQMPYDAVRVTIRSGLADAQLQSSPVSGYLVENVLFPGIFAAWEGVDGSLKEINSDTWNNSRIYNERREITIETNKGLPVVMVQIATKTARRLACGLPEGKRLTIGCQVGMACIAGITEIYFPANWTLMVAVGQRVVGVETVLAASYEEVVTDV